MLFSIRVEVATGREHLAAGALDDHAIDGVVAVDVAPHIDQLSMHDGVGGVVLLRAVHRDPQHLGMRAIEHQGACRRFCQSDMGSPPLEGA